MSLRHALLGFLSMRPMSGYDLKRRVDESVGHFWTADQAAIYRTLSELDAQGLVMHERVAQMSRPDRKVFHLTEAGREALDAWLAAPMPPVPRREPLLVKLFFAGRLSAESLRDLLTSELAHAETELAGYRAILEAVDALRTPPPEAAQLGPVITLTYGVRAATAQREWLRGLLARQQEGTLTVHALLEEIRQSLKN
jgi:DNA-binding PadR family transcriptional regulator